MKSTVPTLFIIATALATVNAASHHNKKDRFCWDRVKTVFVFGDSYSYVNGEKGTDWYTWSNWRSTDQVLNNKIVPGKTSSGGPVWDQYLTGCFEGLPAKCNIQLWNFAYGGATIDPDVILNVDPSAASLVEQVDQWTEQLDPVLEWEPSQALGAFLIGLNDVSYTTSWSNFTSSMYDEMLTTYFDKADRLYQKNLRNFLFANIPSWSRAPIGLANQSIPYAEYSSVYNHKLKQHIAKFRQSHADAYVFSFDTNAQYNHILNHPSTYGIEDITSFCPNSTASDINTNYEYYGCKPISKYFWFNSAHPTYVIHELMGNAMKKQLQRSSFC